MADFARWGAAISEVLWGDRDIFLKAYNENINSQNDEAVESSPVGLTISEFMKGRDRWEGTASELLNELEEIAASLSIKRNVRGWPSAPNWLSRQLQEISANLSERGIIIERDEKARPRKLILKNINPVTDDTDGNSDLDEIERLSEPLS